MTGPILRLATVLAAAAGVLAATAHPAFRDAAPPAGPVTASAAPADARQIPRTGGGPARLHLWRDARGVVNVTSEAMLAPRHARTVDLPAPAVAEGAAPAGTRAGGGLAGMLAHGPLEIYTADGLAALMADAERVAARLQERRELLARLRSQL